jgi:hypothetical protein
MPPVEGTGFVEVLPSAGVRAGNSHSEKFRAGPNMLPPKTGTVVAGPNAEP